MSEHRSDPSPALRSHPRRRRVVSAVTILVGVALVAAACTGDRDLGAPTGRTATLAPIADWDPTALPALPAVAADGPAAPLPDAVVLDGPGGLSTSTRPVLRWPDAPGGSVRFTVRTLSGGDLWTAESSTGELRVDEGVLTQGSVVRWSAEGGGRTYGPFPLQVDVQRVQVQPVRSFGAVSVAASTGEALLSWSTPPVSTVAGDASITLAWQPSNPSAPGLPAGWRLLAASPTTWTSLQRVGDGNVELTDAGGTVVAFAEGEPGAWSAVWGEGRTWPTGRYSDLAANGDGTWTITDRDGTVTTVPASTGDEVDRPSASWSAGEPSLQQRWDGAGRLAAVQDPVSGREITLTYAGGSDACPEPTDGFDAVPAGLLCRITAWDGSRTDVGYVGVGPDARLARFVAGAQAAPRERAVTDLAWDAAGRLAAVRSPLAAAAAASGVLTGLGPDRAADPLLLTTLTYDDAGRVARVDRPAGVAPGDAGSRTRDARTFAYPVPGTLETLVPGRAEPLDTVVTDPATFLTLRTVDPVGRESRSTWDPATSAPLRSDLPGGFAETWRYDDAGNLLEHVGPVAAGLLASPAAPRTVSTYDDRPEGEGTRPMEGLATTYWDNRNFQGTPVGRSTGPEIDGAVPSTLSFNWTTPPVAGAGAWSARLLGLVRAPQAGTYTFAVDGAARLWVGGLACRPTCATRMADGALVQVRVDVASASDGTAGVAVNWSGPGAEGAVPTAALRPGYPQATSQTTTESLAPGAGLASVGARLRLDPGAPDRVAGAVSASGAEAGRTYESYRPDDGRWGRSTSYTPVSGGRVTTAYWAGRGETRSGCDREAAVQSGLPRSITFPGPDGGPGLVRSQSYDAAGRVAERRLGDRTVQCLRRDGAGRVVEERFPAVGDAPQVVGTIDHSTGGNPLLVSTRTVEGDRTDRTSTTLDVLGREVGSTDAWGTVTSTTYVQQFDLVDTVTSRTSAGDTTSTRTTWTDDQQVAALTVDGRLLATYAHDPASGALTSVQAADGPRVALGYDDAKNVSERSVTAGGATVGEQAGYSPTGRLLARTLIGPDGRAGWSYGYDLDGRLVSADLTTPLDVTGREFRYRFGGPGGSPVDRTAKVVDGRETTSTYDPSGRLVATTDPAFAAGFAYDDEGRATRAGELRLAYDATGAVSSVSDGTTTVRWINLAGTPIGRTVSVAAPPVPSTSPSTAAPATSNPATSAPTTATSTTAAPTTATSTTAPTPSEPTTTAGAVGGVASGATASGAADSSTSRSSAQGTLLDGRNRIVARYVPLGAGLLAELRADSPVTWRISDLTGAEVWSAVGAGAPSPTVLFDPDGNRLTPSAGVSTDATRPDLGWLGGAGEVSEPTSPGVLRLGPRTYLPALATFLQPDPVANGSASPYDYAAGDPVNAADPSGNMPEWAKWAIKVAVTVIVGVVVGALTAGIGTAVWAKIAVTVAAGAAAGFAGELLGQVIVNAADGDAGTRWNDLDYAEAGYAAAIGAVLGGITRTATLARAGAFRAGGGAGRAASVSSNGSQWQPRSLRVESVGSYDRATKTFRSPLLYDQVDLANDSWLPHSVGGTPVRKLSTNSVRSVRSNSDLQVQQ